MRGDDDLVLIVEDDEDDRALIARAFKRAKVEVPLQFAQDGDEALQALGAIASGASHPPPSVVLLDLKLPRRSGFEVLEWMKQHVTMRRVPVVILTSSQESTDLKRAYDLGANSYLVKPAKPDALLAMVERIDAYWLKLNKAAAQSQ
ncbi:MAG TPA: response regulator [Microvirga sp.]|jgi:CheY-like chemotaxis protein|nr:response regulator [Microvirga sp.]